MAKYNTYSDAANTAVRAFLTQVGEHYLGKKFNTGSGSGKETWESIKKEFANKCAYCNQEPKKLETEHLQGLNQREYGLHHPGNVVPSCNKCNTRRMKEADDESGRKRKMAVGWKEQLRIICKEKEGKDWEVAFKKRKEMIESSINKYSYPSLTENQQNAIRIMAVDLYNKIKASGANADTLYVELAKSFAE